MEKNMDKSLLFITLSAVCVWLVVDVAMGKNYLGGFLSTLFPFMADGDSAQGESNFQGFCPLERGGSHTEKVAKSKIKQKNQKSKQ